VKARLHFDAELHELAERVAAAVGLVGSFCLQVMKDENGRWVVTDVNPRMGGGTAMSLAGGLDFAAAHLAYHWDEDWKPFLPELDRERYVARYYSHVSL
jgi:biotin carboxylase